MTVGLRWRHALAHRRTTGAPPPDRHARARLRRVLLAGVPESSRRNRPIGTRVSLEADPHLDNVDLVRAGAAAPYFYGHELGKYALRMLADAQRAKAAKRGLWGACSGTALDPYRAVDTGISGPPTSRPRTASAIPTTRRDAFRRIRPTSTAPTSGRWASHRSGALAATHTASTVTTTGSGASRGQARAQSGAAQLDITPIIVRSRERCLETVRDRGSGKRTTS